MNNVLLTTHYMLGCDAHAVTPACLVGASLHWVMRSSFTEKVCCKGHSTMHRGTDILSGIPHVPTFIVSPFAWGAAAVATAFSGSKSHFGVARVLVDAGSSTKPVAVAVFGALSMNLNCGDVPMPTGIVNAQNTVVAQMSRADYLGGAMAMATDGVAQAVINKIFGKILPGNNWRTGLRTGLSGAIVGTPLGFSFNSGGNGPLGFVGRMLGADSDSLRSVGEDLGGDAEVAQETRAGSEEARRAEFNFDTHRVTIGQDLQTIFDASPLNRAPARTPLSDFMSPPSTDEAFDNPGAEQFP